MTDCRQLLSTVALLALGACEQRADVAFDGEVGTALAPHAEHFVARMQAAALTTAHVGVRRYAVHLEDEGAYFEYTERVADSGEGCFQIEPREVDSNLVDPFLFLGIQEERQSFLRRYRDFQIHDAELFLESYTVRDEGVQVTVAGRECSELVVEHRLDGHAYTLAVDVETALVLAYRESLDDGTPLSSMTYEQFTSLDDGGAADIDCFESAMAEEELVLREDLAAQIGFETWRPSLLPDGYQPMAASRVRDPRGFDWLKLTFSDGVETLFFLQCEPDGGERVLAQGQPADAHDDRVFYLEEGALSVIQGTLDSRDVVVVGKVDAEELFMLLESSRP